MEEVGEPSWELVRRQSLPAAGSQARAAAGSPRTGCLGGHHPSAPALAASPTPAAQCSLVRGGAQGQPAAQCGLLQRAHLLECLFFFFFFQKGQRERVTCLKLIKFSTANSYLFLHCNNRDNRLLLWGRWTKMTLNNAEKMLTVPPSVAQPKISMGLNKPQVLLMLQHGRG